ncbi:hypothetical protein H1C71_041078 [Ictidomys tridecemlineatus]|nr:hypothetical protein H1C71_041078 [Ictidomys tridecemlineatus]
MQRHQGSLGSPRLLHAARQADKALDEDFLPSSLGSQKSGEWMQEEKSSTNSSESYLPLIAASQRPRNRKTHATGPVPIIDTASGIEVSCLPPPKGPLVSMEEDLGPSRRFCWKKKHIMEDDMEALEGKTDNAAACTTTLHAPSFFPPTPPAGTVYPRPPTKTSQIPAVLATTPLANQAACP